MEPAGDSSLYTDTKLMVVCSHDVKEGPTDQTQKLTLIYWNGYYNAADYSSMW